MTFDLERFHERAAIMEYEGGMSRFAAETEAAKAQGVPRWQAMQEAGRAIGVGHTEAARDHRQAAAGASANNMPGVQRHTAEEVRPVPKRELRS